MYKYERSKELLKFLLAAIMLLVLSVPVALANNKATICHVPPGNPENAHTITISENALKAHLGNNEEGLHGGDYRGECLSTSTPKPTPSMSAAPSPEQPGASPTLPTPSATPTEPDGQTLVPDTAMSR